MKIHIVLDFQPQKNPNIPVIVGINQDQGESKNEPAIYPIIHAKKVQPAIIIILSKRGFISVMYR